LPSDLGHHGTDLCWTLLVDEPMPQDAGTAASRTMLTTLLLSFGAPMLLGGDELGRAQGNNNAYCQDNPITWFDWTSADEQLIAFTRRLIRLRRTHPVFRRRRFLTSVEATELRWFTPAGVEMTPADWADPGARSIAVYLDGADNPDRAPDGTPLVDDDFLLLVNGWWDPLDFSIPPTRDGQIWHPQLDTYEATDVPAAAEFVTGETGDGAFAFDRGAARKMVCGNDPGRQVWSPDRSIRRNHPVTVSHRRSQNCDEGSAAMKDITRPMVWRGILAIIVGIIAIAWPGITVWALVILFAVYAFMNAAVEAARGFSSDRAGPVAGHLLLALLDVVAGVIALAWPDITALALATLIAIWAFVIGFFEIYLAFTAGGATGERALLGLTGLILISLGVVFASRPDIGALTIAEVYGLFNLVWGVSTLVIAANIRQVDKLA
jgi:uncharacterized membrane protein HdeD (DUF308 family)